MATLAPREARLLPFLGPLLVAYLAVELLTTSSALDGASVALLVIASLGALSPRWFLRASELRPTRGALVVDAHAPASDGRRRLSWLGLCTAAVAVARAATGDPSDVGSGLLELAGSVAAPWVGALALDLAFVTPDPLGRGRASSGLDPTVALRMASYAAASALSVMEAVRTAPVFDLDGVGLVIVPHSAGWATLGFVFLCALAAVGARAARRRLGSEPEALASNDWALVGLAATLVTGSIAAVLVAVSASPERSTVVRGLLAASLGAMLLGHLAMTDSARPVRAARTLRALLAALGALAVAAALAMLFRSGASAHASWLDWAVRGMGVAIVAGVAFASLRAIADRALAPDGGRLLEALQLARARATAARSLEQLAEAVLPPLRAAARDLAAAPSILALDPDREAFIDAAGVAHVEARAASPALFERLLSDPREVLVAAPLIARAVRRPETRALVEALVKLDALAVVPLSADDLEGALVVPRGRRRHAVTLEELAELEALGRELGARIAGWSAEVRAQERSGRALLEIARLEERIGALEDELADRGSVGPRHSLAPAPREVAYAPSARAAQKALEDAAPRDTPLLVIVEPGTPVEPWARRAHERGPRAEQPLVWVDCAEGSAETLELTLFGAPRSGEQPEIAGALREAGRGTVVLVDVLALPERVQGRLAESIATRTLQVGDQAHPLVCRVVATACRPLDAGTAPIERAGLDAIDAELARRLGAQSVVVPPLASRLEDVASLVLLAIERACRRRGRQLLGIEEDALGWLKANAVDDGERGLARAVDRAVAVAAGGRITRNDVERALAGPGVTVGDDPLDATLSDVEERALLRALQRAQGNKSEAARLLGLKRTTFLDKLRRLGIDDGSERPSA